MSDQYQHSTVRSSANAYTSSAPPPSIRSAADACSTTLAFVFAKNERANIEKCLRALSVCGFRTVVLDSGSTDGTVEFVSTSGVAEVRHFDYVDHLSSYRQLTMAGGTDRCPWVLILDADMEISLELANEVYAAMLDQRYDVVIAPISMYVEGLALTHGSMYPPKPIAFRLGREYFVAAGHGEKLANDVSLYKATAPLIHNDLKSYEAFVATQVHYGRQLAVRWRGRCCRRRDRLRATTPLMGFAAAAYSLIVRRGLLSGRAGFVYALDRVIAGLIQFRVCLATRSGDRDGAPDSFGAATRNPETDAVTTDERAGRCE